MSNYKERLEKRRKRHRYIMLFIAIVLIIGMISVSFMAAL